MASARQDIHNITLGILPSISNITEIENGWT